jgi:hypothetical protein
MELQRALRASTFNLHNPTEYTIMNRFQYRAYYEFNGPSHADPFRSKKADSEVAEALARFPQDLQHFIDPLATVETPQVQTDPASCYVIVVTPADEPTTDEAVRRCLNSLDLFGQKTDAS